MESEQMDNQSPEIKNKGKKKLYIVLFFILLSLIIGQYVTVTMVSNKLKQTMNTGLPEFSFKDTKVSSSLFSVFVETVVVPVNKHDKTEYSDFDQELDIEINVYDANLDKFRQLVGGKSEFEQYTLVADGTITSEDYENPINIEMNLDGDFSLKSAELPLTEFSTSPNNYIVYSSGADLEIEKVNGELSINYQMEPMALYSEIVNITFDSARYRVVAGQSPILKFNNVKFVTPARTMSDYFRGKNEDEEPSSITSDIEITGLDMDTVFYAMNLYSEASKLEDGEFRKTKLNADLQELTKRLIENSMSIKTSLNIEDRGKTTQYDIALQVQSDHEITSYKEILSAITGAIDRVGPEPSAKNLRKFDRVLAELGEKTELLEYRALALQ